MLRDALTGAAMLLALAGLPHPALAAGAGIPQVADEELEQVLLLAGANRSKLEKALDYATEQQDLSAPAMRFLVMNLPLADLGCVTGDYLIENVALALEARERMPFTAAYGDDVWAHYVLPHRVSQEPLERWRRYFYDELSPLVRDCTTIEEAIQVVYGWVGERIHFKQTQRRDQGPLTTLKGKYGRCEELMIVYIDTLRSVGIPARKAFCPWWSHTDNNHAWTEVYLDDGQWYCDEVVGQEQERRGGWVMAAGRKASIVVSVCYGLPDSTTECVLRAEAQPGARYTMLNSIGRYRDASRIELDFDDCLEGLAMAASQPKPYRVYVHVWNYGALRAVTYVYVEPDGRAHIDLGAGTYVLSTDFPGAQRVVLLEVERGTQEHLHWSELAILGEEEVLYFPADS